MRFYRALLRLYPASFRAEYGGPMREVFARRRREAAGLPAVAALYAGALLDTVASAIRVHGDILAQDLRYTARTLARAPGFALTATLVTALGVGATTAAFSITDHVLIRPLPFPEPESLVKLWQDETGHGYSRMELSPPNYRDWKRLSRCFSAMAAYNDISVNLVGGGDPERLDGAAVSAQLFPVLGSKPALGRVFAAEDDRPGAPGTVVLSSRLWRERFGGDRSMLGRKVILDDAPYTVIGVMPPEFHFPSRDHQLWTAQRLAGEDNEDRTNTYLRVVARLKTGTSLEQARAEMRLVAAQLERAYPKENARIGATVVRLREEVSLRPRLLLKALLGAAIGVLLIACTNLASLLLARGLARRRELAVRTALGAGRERLVRQLLTESLVLAAFGGALGVLAAAAAVPLVARLVPNALPIAETPGMDLRVLAFAAFVTLLTGIGFGVFPALRACGAAGSGGLKEDARGGGAGRKTERLRAALVIAEVAASVALLICSGLLIRALWRLQSVDPGFRTDGVLTLRTALPMPKYQETAKRDRFYRSVTEEVRALPGVSGAAYISFLPMVVRGGIWPVQVNGRPEDRAMDEPASLRFVTPGYFSVLRIPIRQGRDVAASDTREAPFVAVVSESFARRYWPEGSPLGRRFRIAFMDRTIVGVAGNVRVRGLEPESEPQVYLPAAQVADNSVQWYTPKDLVIGSSVSPATLLPAIRRIISKADAQLPVSDVQSLAAVVDADTAPRQVQARVLAGFAAIAVLLAGIGIHGLLAFTVSQRAREIGVRIALGAQSRDILRMVMRRGVLLAAVGVVLGAALAYAAGRAIEALLVGVSPGDAPTFSAAILMSLGMTLAGSLAPALHAVRVDPMTVMRSE